ncbi:hypothetical protein D3C72_1530850 [compost metagenome]
MCVFAPLSVSTPVPDLSSAPDPAITPASVRLFDPWTPSPPALSWMAFASDRPATDGASAPPLPVSVPVPKARLLSKLTRPPFSVAWLLTSGPLTVQVPPFTRRLLKFR